MSGTLTLADFVLSLTGKTLFIAGNALSSIGSLYGLEKIITIVIRVIENLKPLLSKSQQKENTNNEPLVTRKELWDTFMDFSKIGVFITIGLVIKMIGNWMNLSTTVDMFNTLLYQKIQSNRE